MSDYIQTIRGREILNANGKPTVEAELETQNGIRTVASVPSGTSRGKYEAHELYDGGTRFDGFGTRKAAGNITDIISKALKGVDITKQEEIDRIMCELDGTPNKEQLGGNAILAVSVAAMRAGAVASNLPLYQYVSQGKRLVRMPDIVAPVMSGGVFSGSGMEFEDYMYVFHSFERFPDELEALVHLRRSLERRLRAKYGNFPEDGGALAAPCKSTAEAFIWMLDTAAEEGYDSRVSLGLDVAASELLVHDSEKYTLGCHRTFTANQLLNYYTELCSKYPLMLIEDGFDQDDFGSFARLKKQQPAIQIVGDDLFVTNPERLKMGIKQDSANSLLLKINQVGTVTEALQANDLARENGYDVIVSLRSGETPDDFIADLAVGIGARQVKLGSPVRAERNTKYNRLLKIYQELFS